MTPEECAKIGVAFLRTGKCSKKLSQESGVEQSICQAWLDGERPYGTRIAPNGSLTSLYLVAGSGSKM